MKYRLLKARFEHAAGTIVHSASGYDYGLCNDDERTTGIEHLSVTLKPDGGCPFFTAPVNILEVMI